MGQRSRTRLVTALMLLGVFGAGALLGFAANGELGAVPSPREAAVGEEPEGEKEDRGGRRGLYMQVDPNESQLAVIDSIVAAHRARTNAREEVFRKEVREMVLSARESIKSVLTPEQAAEYQRVVDEWDAQRAAEREEEEDDERD